MLILLPVCLTVEAVSEALVLFWCHSEAFISLSEILLGYFYFTPCYAQVAYIVCISS